MKMSRPLIKHNPAFLSKEDLKTAFVARHEELNTLLGIIRENIGQVNQHVLIIGPRGMGKTMLVLRLAEAVGDDPLLAEQWFPILLAEETYTISTAGEFWLEAIRVLSRGQAPDRKRWEAIYEKLRTEVNELRLREMALARLLEFSEEKERKLLIIVENLNMILENQASFNTAWDLRKTLLNEPRIMLVTTATVRFGAIENPDQAMYELFRETRLTPLSTEQCQSLWAHITGNELSLRQIRPMEILTGGNPRLIAILASFAINTSFKDLMQDLIVLIDDHTTYFKANVESLPPQERKVFVTLAEIWEPATAREVARLSRLDVNKTSAFMKRLVQRGAVAEVDKKGRKKLYQVSERLYNIYHLMRQSTSEADRARAVVEFMVRFYEPEQVARVIGLEACQAGFDSSESRLNAYAHLLSKYDTDMRQKIIAGTPKEFLPIARAHPQFEKMALIRQATLASQQESDEIKKILKTLHGLMKVALDHFKANLLDKCLKKIDKVLSCFGNREEPKIVELVAMALFIKGFSLTEMGKLDEAIEVFEDVLSRFGNREESKIVELVARALVDKGNALRELKRPDEAMEAVEEVVRRFGKREEANIVELVARALVGKGAMLVMLQQPDKAIEAFEEVVRRFGKREEANIVGLVAMALAGKGLALSDIKESEKALEVYEEVVRRFGKREEANIVRAVAWALVSKGEIFGDTGRHQEAIEASEEAIRRFQTSGIRHSVIGAAFLNVSFALGYLGRWDEALDKITNLFEDANSLEVHSERVIEWLIEAASASLENKILKLFQKFEHLTSKFEPIKVALQMLTGEPYKAPQEIEEVAKDVLERIESKKAEKNSS